MGTEYSQLPLGTTRYEICEDNQEEDNYFSMSHRFALGSKGHFWFLQVGLKYEGENDSKMTLLLGLLALMEILPSAIDGFELHPLDEISTHPALINNRVEDGFPSSAILAFKYCGVKNKQAFANNSHLLNLLLTAITMRKRSNPPRTYGGSFVSAEMTISRMLARESAEISKSPGFRSAGRRISLQS